MRKLVLFILVCCCGISVAGAQQGEDLPEVVVTASRISEPMNEVSLKMVVINQQTIRLSAATTVDQLLSEQNVGHMHTYPGSFTQLSIRGFRSNGESAGFSSPILFLMDGRRAGTVNLAKIPVDLIERIEIIKGASSAVYGAEAMGGVINLVTKRGTGNISASLLAEGGSSSRLRLAAEVEGEQGGVDGYVLVGRKDRRADYRDGNGEVYENTQSRSRDYFVNLGYTLGQQRLGVTILEVDNWHIGSPGAKSYPDFDDSSSKDLRSFDMRYDGAAAQVGLEWLVRYYQVEDSDVASDPAMAYGYRDSIFNTDSCGGQAQLSWLAASNHLTIGFDWDNQEARSKKEPVGTPFSVNADYEHRAIFVADKIELLNQRILLNLGLRYDRYAVETKATPGYTTLRTADEEVSEWCPRLGLVVKASDQLNFRASVGRGFVLPTAAELVGDFVSSGWYQDQAGSWQSYSLHYLGNNNLDPEESWSYEFGADYATLSWSTQLNFFYTEYKNKIEIDSYYDGLRGESVSSFKNVDGATISGMELDAGYTFADLMQSGWSLSPFLSLTYLFDFQNDETDEELLYVSETQVRFGIRSVSDFGLSIQLVGIYNGPQDVQNWNVYPARVEEMGGTTVCNLTVSQTMDLSWRQGSSLVVSAAVENVFDKMYAYVADYPMPGREYTLSAKLTF